MRVITTIYTFFAFASIIYCSAVFIDNNSTKKHIEENPVYWTEEGVWGPLLEEWVLGSRREKRVMRLDNGEDLVIRNEVVPEKESKIYNTKIVNNGSNKPTRMVSETDLYLLSAIEKLSYKVDSAEKRLRKVEEMLYYLMAGNRIDEEQCPNNFTRIGHSCYFFGNAAGREYDWKAASMQCRKLNSVLAEFETIEEQQDVVQYIQMNGYLNGKDFWTGGLNPGLLWIWSNSAKPVSLKNKKGSQNISISGDGRCLRISYNPKSRSYSYKGSDCSVRYNYVCEIIEDMAINEIQRVAKKIIS